MHIPVDVGCVLRGGQRSGQFLYEAPPPWPAGASSSAGLEGLCTLRAISPPDPPSSEPTWPTCLIPKDPLWVPPVRSRLWARPPRRWGAEGCCRSPHARGRACPACPAGRALHCGASRSGSRMPVTTSTVNRSGYHPPLRAQTI